MTIKTLGATLSVAPQILPHRSAGRDSWRDQRGQCLYAGDRPCCDRLPVLDPQAVETFAAGALESLEAIAHRLGSAGVGLHLSKVKGPVMDALKRADFTEHFKGRIFLSQFEAVQALSEAK